MIKMSTLLFLVVTSLSICAFGADGANVNKPKEQRFDGKRFYSFVPMKCWNFSSAPLEDEDMVVFYPGDCDGETDKREIMAIEPISEGEFTDYLSPKAGSHSQDFVFSKQIQSMPSGWLLIELLTAETNPKIDSDEQQNQTWKYLTTCRKKRFGLVFISHLNKKDREESRKSHQVPKEFQKLIDGFKCK